MKNLLSDFMMYLRLLKVQIRSQMQYRFSFWMDLVSTGLLNATLFISFALIIQRFGTIAGWTLAEVAFLIGMAEMSFGLMDMIFSGFDPDTFGETVRTGSFDQVMLRPIGIIWQVLGSRFMLRRLGKITEGIVIFLYALSTLDVTWTLAKILYIPVVAASQVLIMGGLFMAGSTIAFWTIQSVEAVNILTYGGTELMSYPMTIYPPWMQRFFTYAVPFIFINFYPALYFLDKADPLNFPPVAPFLAPVVSAVFFLAAVRFWQIGIHHYQSSGT